jgi:hypothetical protein
MADDDGLRSFDRQLGMLATQLAALGGAIEHIQKSMEGSVARLEALIAREIGEIKTEQIADSKRSIERLADDQRRMWEALRVIETRQADQGGAFRAIHGFAIFAGSLVSGGFVAALSKMWK